MKKKLREIFGFDSFRPLQEEIIQNVMAKNDTLVIMPTGGGKSLCYQLPALLFEGMTIVVSPLISLMKDQVEQLREFGVSAVMLNSAIPVAQFRQNVESIRDQKARLLYIAPESLLKPRIQEMLSDVRVDCFAIDEAHCISFWGHDFRPEYRQLATARKRFSDAGCVALTATATPRVRRDIVKTLGFSNAKEFVASFNRKNLMLRVREKNNAYQQTLEFIRKFPNDSGIIYCFSRKQTDSLADRLKEHGFSALPYHAGLEENERHRNQEAFIRDDVKIMVATIAFGMGINKPNIRFILHHDLPKTLENYYQEIGRAGRDGLDAECLLLFGYGDIQKTRHFLKNLHGDELRGANMRLEALLRYAETHQCRRIPLLSYFGEKYGKTECGMCDNCLGADKELTDVTVLAQKFLSCVVRTREIFGASHVIDVLRGSMSLKVKRHGHDRLSTHGIGKDLSRKQWLRLSRQFLSDEYLKQDSKFGGLSVTDTGWDVLRSKTQVRAFLPPEKPKQIEQPGNASIESQTPAEHDKALFEDLRQLRKSLADRSKIPPYAVFPDKTLIEMASWFPMSRQSLELIHGVGRVKLEKYGDLFLEHIRKHCQKHGIEEVFRGGALLDSTGASGGQKRFEQVGQACAQGNTIPRLMKMFDVKEQTICSHLYNYLLDGHRLEPGQFYEHCRLDEDLKKQVLDRFDRLGIGLLRPVYDSLDGKVNYDDLRCMSLYYLAKKSGDIETEDVFGKGNRVVGQSRPGKLEMVCLAASRKYGGYCLAGKLLGPGDETAWVRPVSETRTGELSKKRITLEDGTFPRLLDILEITAGKKLPRGCQSENFLLPRKPMARQGSFPPSRLEKLCDRPETLWINNCHGIKGENDRIPVELVETRIENSLYLIRPENPAILVEEGQNLLKRIRIKFIFNQVSHRLIVTDPKIENRYLSEDLGEYPIRDNPIYLTISISEPYHGYCYKLAAAVIGIAPAENQP